MEEDFKNNLFQSYRTASKNLSKFAELESKHWENFNSEVREIYFDKKLEDLNLLENFRFDKSLSAGMDDALDRGIPDAFFHLLKEVEEDVVISNLDNKNIGNCNRVLNFKDKYIDYGDLFHIYVFSQLNDSIFSKDKISSICEIGGGFGALARVIKNNLDVSYIMIDLPETNLVSAYYLYENFKNENKKFLLYNQIKDNKISVEQLHSYDFIIIPPWVVFEKDLKIDLFVNCRSMMEMERKVIRDYFKIIHGHTNQNGYFLNINRYHKRTVGQAIKLIDYPYDRDWEVLISQKAIYFDHIHFLLTQRKEPKEKSIHSVLEGLLEETKKHTPSYFYSELKKLVRKILTFFLPKSFLKKMKQFFLVIDPE
ncbi:uncharacterized protein METZ01_LOCUS306120 [marine metagenome]|uniref:Sugar O-methyltransferase n=1 Tax=marine metagenome TaxID=408172 RepID=A0A382MWW6_9ZZZZ